MTQMYIRDELKHPHVPTIARPPFPTAIALHGLIKTVAQLEDVVYDSVLILMWWRRNCWTANIHIDRSTLLLWGEAAEAFLSSKKREHTTPILIRHGRGWGVPATAHYNMVTFSRMLALVWLGFGTTQDTHRRERGRGEGEWRIG